MGMSRIVQKLNALVFRDHDKTLEESEISAAMKKILNGLEGLGIELRS